MQKNNLDHQFNSIELTNEEEIYYTNLFNLLDKQNKGKIDIRTAATFLKKSNLSQEKLKRIWSASSKSKNNYMTKDEFFMALRLIALAQNNLKIGVKNPPLPDFGIPDENEEIFKIPEAVVLIYKQYFEANKDSDKYISTKKSIEIWKRNATSDFTIKKVADSIKPVEKKGFLNLKEFQVANHLLSLCNCREIPKPLPNCLLQFLGRPLNKKPKISAFLLEKKTSIMDNNFVQNIHINENLNNISNLNNDNNINIENINTNNDNNMNYDNFNNMNEGNINDNMKNENFNNDNLKYDKSNSNNLKNDNLCNNNLKNDNLINNNLKNDDLTNDNMNNDNLNNDNLNNGNFNNDNLKYDNSNNNSSKNDNSKNDNFNKDNINGNDENNIGENYIDKNDLNEIINNNDDNLIEKKNNKKTENSEKNKKEIKYNITENEDTDSFKNNKYKSTNFETNILKFNNKLSNIDKNRNNNDKNSLDNILNKINDLEIRQDELNNRMMDLMKQFNTLQKEKDVVSQELLEIKKQILKMAKLDSNNNTDNNSNNNNSNNKINHCKNNSHNCNKINNNKISNSNFYIKINNNNNYNNSNVLPKPLNTEITQNNTNQLNHKKKPNDYKQNKAFPANSTCHGNEDHDFTNNAFDNLSLNNKIRGNISSKNIYQNSFKNINKAENIKPIRRKENNINSNTSNAEEVEKYLELFNS